MELVYFYLAKLPKLIKLFSLYNIMDKEVYKELINTIKNLTVEVQHNNKLLSKDTQLIEHNMFYYIKRYIQEFIEACIGLLFVMFIMKKSFTLSDLSKIASIVGVVTLILEEYNLDSASHFKQGIYSTLGSVTFNTK